MFVNSYSRWIRIKKEKISIKLMNKLKKIKKKIWFRFLSKCLYEMKIFWVFLIFWQEIMFYAQECSRSEIEDSMDGDFCEGKWKMKEIKSKNQNSFWSYWDKIKNLTFLNKLLLRRFSNFLFNSGLPLNYQRNLQKVI